MKLRSLSAVALVPMLVGCLNETRTYSLSVRNGLTTPIRVCLTKSNGPSEPDWMSPEEAAAPPHPASDQRPPGQILKPGQTASLSNVAGSFDPRFGRAFLRVYLGDPTLTEMLAISAGSSNRVDVPLDPGPNRLVVQLGRDGRMTAEHADPAAK